jgi:hypothetical protein
MKDSLLAHLRGADGTDAAVRIAADDTAISAETTAPGILTRSVKVEPRHNEEGGLAICAILIAKLNRDGATWPDPQSQPEGLDSDVDYRSSDKEGRNLDMQVTRPGPEQFWAHIGRTQQAHSHLAVDEAVHHLKNAIVGKNNIPSLQKAKLHLVLDATQTPDLAFAQVAAAFRANHISWARGLGFEAIWLIGPAPDFVHRLDA